MNNVSLIGRLTADPEKRQTASGGSVVSFTLAVDRRGKDGVLQNFGKIESGQARLQVQRIAFFIKYVAVL